MFNEQDLIKQFAEEFTLESLQGQNPAGLCLPTSLFLQLYLATKQIKCDIIKVDYPKRNHDNTIENIGHFLLYIKSNDIIIDATIKQFNNSDYIYVGKKKDNPITKSYILTEMDYSEWFPIIFGVWECPFIDIPYPYQEFHKRMIPYTIKLATTLHEELVKLGKNDEFINKKYGEYMKPIYIFLNNWHTSKIDFELDKENMPTGFKNLLSSVIHWNKVNN